MERFEASLDDDGAVVVPPRVAAALGLTDTTTVRVRVAPARFDVDWVEAMRPRLRAFFPTDQLASEALIAERRAENARDEWETLRDMAEFWGRRPMRR